MQIRRLREERGLTLSALAQLAGTSVPTMHRYESGWNRFEVNTLRKIAAALGSDLEVRLVPAVRGGPGSKPKLKELLRLLNPLFWDCDPGASDLEDHQAWVLGRVLMFGTEVQVSAARRYFGDEAIREALGRREIDARTRNFWNLIVGEECGRRS
jgi:transcriptional regulator with XRE-family HTH domain